ncbi:AAA family ATPase [Ferrimonas senticii]|uniref:AAA family ATPase n=1 Tax=Ferrimonas senticii TaxID=394566 RepID=UPI00041BCEEA|nr:AAA family ATPase [Ferrimonas senticii]
MTPTSPLPQINRLIDAINHDLFERKQTVALALLTAIAGQHSFLLGPPGTGKSLLARRIALAFADARYFECLMNRFSTPDEVFGPVSLAALKQDRYQRKIDGYLPAVEFAFLDEIWKSSPAILNTLLTLINERQFRNGEQQLAVPLKGLIAASNELPQPDQGLEALYDRFLVRLEVTPTEQWHNFAQMLCSAPAQADIALADGDPIDAEQHQQWLTQIAQVEIGSDSLTLLQRLRQLLSEQQPELYVSDRRWQRAAQLLRASAFCCGRRYTNHSDLLLLRHCLWSQPQQRQAVAELLEQCVMEVACPCDIDVSGSYQQLDILDQQLNQLLFYPETVFDTCDFYPQQHFFGVHNEQPIAQRDGFFYVRTHAEHNHNAKAPVYFDFFVHQSQRHSRRPFHPYDPLGPLKTDIQCQFSESGLMTIRYAEHGNFDTSAFSVKPFKPTVLHQQGEARQRIDGATLTTLQQQLMTLAQQLSAAIKQAKAYQQQFEQAGSNPFISAEEQQLLELAFSQQQADLELNLLRTQALLTLANDNQPDTAPANV